MGRKPETQEVGDFLGRYEEELVLFILEYGIVHWVRLRDGEEFMAIYQHDEDRFHGRLTCHIVFQTGNSITGSKSRSNSLVRWTKSSNEIYENVGIIGRSTDGGKFIGYSFYLEKKVCHETTEITCLFKMNNVGLRMFGRDVVKMSPRIMVGGDIRDEMPPKRVVGIKRCDPIN
ncbi:hypothetical protein Adt_20183 [Abeliophyllum distichum]|uniref:Uncharacterized protein n=1 Tax=Abeliophyllum distichum TaxID=126358 RepID=A0ABD1SVV8_9LAMI